MSRRRKTAQKVSASGFGREPVNGAATTPTPKPIDPQPGTLVIPRSPGARLGTAIREDTDPGTIRALMESALYGDHESAHRVFTTMENTWDRLVKNMHELRRASSKARFSVQPYAAVGEQPSELAIEKASLINRAIDGWKGDSRKNQNSFTDFIYDITDAVGKGLSVQELVWELKGSEWLPVASYWCDPRFYGVDPQGEALGLRNIPGSPNWTPFADDQFIVGVFKNRSGPLLGYGLFRTIAWWWSVGIFARKWMARYAELFGIPFRVVKSHKEASSSEKASILADLVAMGDSGCMVIPDGAEFIIQEASKSAGDLPQKALLDMRDKTVDILILGQTLTTDVGDSGSRALGDVHANVKTERLVEVADWSAEIINCQLIPSILRKNYGNVDEAPLIVLDQSESGDPLEMAQRDEILNRIMPLSKQWMHDRHKVPKPEEGEEVIEVAAAPAPAGDGGFGAFASQPRTITAAAPDKISPTDQLLNRVIEDISGVSEKFLAPIKPTFARLIALAQRGDVPDGEFIEAVEKLIAEMPELFDMLDRDALQQELQRAMGAAAVNGAADRMTATPGAADMFQAQ